MAALTEEQSILKDQASSWVRDPFARAEVPRVPQQQQRWGL